MNDRLHQLLITVSRLDMEKLHPVARFAELLKFFGLLIVVSIGLIVGSIEHRTGWGSGNKKVWAGIQVRLNELRSA